MTKVLRNISPLGPNSGFPCDR